MWRLIGAAVCLLLAMAIVVIYCLLRMAATGERQQEQLLQELAAHNLEGGGKEAPCGDSSPD